MYTNYTQFSTRWEYPNSHHMMGCDSDKKFIWLFEDILKGNISVLQ